MQITIAGSAPTIHPTAFVAPNALVCGDVTIGPGARIMYGAQVIAESGSITIGRNCIVFENAVLRSSSRNPLRIADHCLMGPHSHLTGCTLLEEVFIATGATVFHGAHLAKACEVRVNAVVHANTRLAPTTMVPIGWIAVGNPAEVLPPSEHARIWKLQEPMNFPLQAYGMKREEATTKAITRALSSALNLHMPPE